MKKIFSQIKRFQDIDFKEGEAFSFVLTQLNPPNSVDNNSDNNLHTEQRKMEINGKYKVVVKKYMTEPSSGTFDFQDNWNNGVPMPMCIMTGTLLQETRGMYKMELRGKAAPSITCSVCGKPLNNLVSKLYGIGPTCSEKLGLIRIESEEDAKTKWLGIVKQVEDITWTGWIIKSAILEWEEL